MKPDFEWDTNKNKANQTKHGVDFKTAQHAFLDPHRVIAQDSAHNQNEKRFYCFGKVRQGILTVRFTLRNHTIRIIGAGYWRKGKQIYEQQNNLH